MQPIQQFSRTHIQVCNKPLRHLNAISLCLISHLTCGKLAKLPPFQTASDLEFSLRV
jgi:hypothetical protein